MKKKREYAAVLLLALGYVLGVKEGKLAVWTAEDPEPVHVFSIRADTLPPADQILLRRGIYAENERSLMEILEDYLQ